jgi:hypothetical protein
MMDRSLSQLKAALAWLCPILLGDSKMPKNYRLGDAANLLTISIAFDTILPR